MSSCRATNAKWRDTPKNYPQPAHRVIVEPFAGSAGYSLRYPDREVVLCDIDPAVAGVWRYLIDVSPAEVLGLPDLLDAQSVDDLRVCQEARWLIGFWLNRAAASPRKAPSAWMRSGIRPGSFWGERVRRTIAMQVPRIRHWMILEASYELTGITGQATWFIDPPYQRAGTHYRFGSSLLDYAALGEWCQSRAGQVIVCEADGADWLPFESVGMMKATRTGTRSAEALWTNDPDLDLSRVPGLAVGG